MEHCPENNNYSKWIDRQHTYDNLTLLLFSTLLMLSVITIWVFKHKRFNYIHETGLSVFYGLIVGLVTKLMYSNEAHLTHITISLHLNGSNLCNAPSRIFLNITDSKHKQENDVFYKYGYMETGQNKSQSILQEKLTFNSEIFFNILLPPIIFSAGYSMKKRHFFTNIGSILSLAFIGTLVSSFVVGIICFALTRSISTLKNILHFSDCLKFGAMISATDPVTVLAIFNDLSVDFLLYALVFGESVLNDAVAIILTQSIETLSATSGTNISLWSTIGWFFLHFIEAFFGAFALGVCVAIVTALVTKYTHIRNFPQLETAFFALMSYTSFLLAETLGFSGIVSVLFCGITQAHYTHNNLSDTSRVITHEFFDLLNFLAENFVFAYIGVSVFTYKQHNWNLAFIFISLLAIVVARAANVYPLSFLLNRGRTNKISFAKQHFMTFSGLRGAMAFSLAIRSANDEISQMFFSTTVVIVMVTVFLCGGLSVPLLKFLNIRMGLVEPTGDLSDVRNAPNLSPYSMTERKAFLAYWFSKFDRTFLKPLFTHSGPLLSDSCCGCCKPIAELLTTEEQLIRYTTTDSGNSFRDTALIINKPLQELQGSQGLVFSDVGNMAFNDEYLEGLSISGLKDDNEFKL